MGLAGTGLAALEDDYTRNNKYHGEDANTKHGCTGVRYLLVLAGVGITLVLVGIVALVGLGPCRNRAYRHPGQASWCSSQPDPQWHR